MNTPTDCIRQALDYASTAPFMAGLRRFRLYMTVREHDATSRFGDGTILSETTVEVGHLNPFLDPLHPKKIYPPFIRETNCGLILGNVAEMEDIRVSGLPKIYSTSTGTGGYLSRNINTDKGIILTNFITYKTVINVNSTVFYTITSIDDNHTIGKYQIDQINDKAPNQIDIFLKKMNS